VFIRGKPVFGPNGVAKDHLASFVFTVWRIKEQLSIISVAQLKAWKHL
jgi:hypothetical protein